ncbi:MAG: serine/threonine-protein kinase [Betaproteobacteria bacterium]|nr:serine/threonine-protein kinase [Betaproteobacteria bacterium]
MSDTRFGKFELRKVIGKGATGTVYLARDTFSEMDVALKVLDPDVVREAELEGSSVRQFMNEASLAGKLTHPHIASIYEAVVNQNSGYIAIEYVPGGDLRQYTAPNELLPVADAVEIAFKCCGALDYAYRQGIVHRDIKPANIMVVEGTNIKLADFGAAFFRRAHDTQIQMVGSPLYMSPEQIQGKDLGQQSDMFSLGVVLYELFTGRRPFLGDNLSDVLNKVLSEDPPPPSVLREGLTTEIDRILLKMLRKSRKQRYATWADLALALASVGRMSVFQQEVPDSEKYLALRKVAFLKELNDSEIWELLHAGKWKRVPAQSVILREGDTGNTLLLLGGGQAKVTKQDRLLNLLNAGEYFGDMAYVKEGAIPRQATVTTMTEALVAEFSAIAVRQTSTRCQLQLTNALLSTLVERLALADARSTAGGG